MNVRLLLPVLAILAAGSGCATSVEDMPASTATATPSPTATGAALYHPAGWSASDVHGTAAKMQEQDCRSCHGQNFEGIGNAVSCDTCHTPGWQQNCTFCHGGTDNTTGAPPRGINGSSTVASFDVHTKHVSDGPMHKAYDCVQCHVKPVGALDPDHWWDNTPGKAEVDFTGGIADTSVYDGNGSCETYCHGTGRGTNGLAVGVTPVTPITTCDSCHAFKTSATAAMNTMSGFHTKHLQTALGGAINCVDCHAQTVDAAGNLIAPAKHVNGVREVAFAAGNNITMTNLACNGTCHGQNHIPVSYKWNGTGAHHPAGFNDPVLHGPAMKQQGEDCRVCHGADLKGGSVGVSCDTCHTATWRTDCTFCHGNAATGQSAPPRDINGNTNAATISFKAHTKHVTQGDHPAYDCNQCHKKPVDVLSAGHNFDGSKGKAEVVFSGGLSAMGTYGGAGSCSTLYCHGTGRAANGTYTDNSTTPTCATCHPFLNSTSTQWGTMSGSHRKHLGMSGVTCYDCHANTVASNNTVATAANHVNGLKDIKFGTSSVAFNATTKKCTGTCHNQNHNETW